MTKEKLKQYTKLKRERQKLEELLLELEGEIYAPRTQRLDSQPGGGSNPDAGSEVERATVKHDELLQRYRRKVLELAEAMETIEKAIETLDPTERTVFRLHYLQGLTWEQVADSVSYSWRQVHRIHSRGLQKLKEVET